MEVAIGIDLGTTNCCMAYVDGDKPVIIKLQNGSYTMPSYIAFPSADEILFGKTAVNRRAQNEANTIFDVKRFIGRNFNDPHVQNCLDRWKFHLVDQDGQIMVEVKNGDVDKMYSPEMLSGFLLRHLKKQAELHLGNEVSKAYITVPSYFNDAQRQSTIDAGKIAGFEEVRLLNEPTAAAIAYSTANCSEEERMILVFDFGGGTFDVSLIKYKNRDIEVMAIDGDIELGGNDITNNILDNYARTFVDDFNNFNIYSNARKYYRFLQICEDAKTQLSEGVEAHLQIYNLFPEDVENFVLQRDEFNKLNDDIFKRTIKIVDRCLKRSKVEIKDLDDIVVVGGSTRNKMILVLLEEYFKKPLMFNINADEAVAMGAAIAASKWVDNESFSDLMFQDICPYSLGVEVFNKEMTTVIPKFSSLPATGTRTYGNATDDQTSVLVKIFSGENERTTHNNFLGELQITEFIPGPAKSVKFDVTFTYDKDCILNVNVEVCDTIFQDNVIIHLDKGRLSPSELENQKETVEKEYKEYENLVDFKEMRQTLIDKGSTEGGCTSVALNITYSEDNLKLLREMLNSDSKHQG